jgi:hypothetical protein
MIKEARFSDNMGAGIETAHNEIIDCANALAGAALTTPPTPCPTCEDGLTIAYMKGVEDERDRGKK